MMVNFNSIEIEDTGAGRVFSFKEEAFNGMKAEIIMKGGYLVEADEDGFRGGGRGGIKEMRAGDKM
jgi:hypothetical protein